MLIDRDAAIAAIRKVFASDNGQLRSDRAIRTIQIINQLPAAPRSPLELAAIEYVRAEEHEEKPYLADQTKCHRELVNELQDAKLALRAAVADLEVLPAAPREQPK